MEGRPLLWGRVRPVLERQQIGAECACEFSKRVYSVGPAGCTVHPAGTCGEGSLWAESQHPVALNQPSAGAKCAEKAFDIFSVNRIRGQSRPFYFTAWLCEVVCVYVCVSMCTQVCPCRHCACVCVCEKRGITGCFLAQAPLQARHVRIPEQRAVWSRLLARIPRPRHGDCGMDRWPHL